MGKLFDTATSLTRLLKEFKTERQKVLIRGKVLEAFHALKKLAFVATVLKAGAWSEPFIIISGASNIAIGAVLQHDKRSVAYNRKR